MPLSPLITDPDALDAAWLTQALYRAGILTVGQVREVQVETAPSDNGLITRMRPSYSPDEPGPLPAALLLKICTGVGFVGRSEVDFYTKDYVDLPDPPFPRCYDAGYDEATGAYHLLLHDVSATHQNNWRVTPTLAYGYGLAESLAALHAHHWGKGLNLPDAAVLNRYMANITPGLQPMLDSLADGIDASWRQALSDIFARHPAALLARTASAQGFTLVHGDTNPGNILGPKSGEGRVYLIDRQPFDWSLTTWLGVRDLSYAMVHWWPTELRRQFEQPVLQRYHAQLTQRGVSGYSWEQLWNDYRLTAGQSIYVAVAWGVSADDLANMRWVWWPQLQKAMAAFFDLRCW
ncbi:MAG: aminoglycoside phosphotransferase family protein, partial [Chloroflexaceae bacterium]|nr:aminoglycoside phosphotransferase family protein [Chloroflexaceae bacterium]